MEKTIIVNQDAVDKVLDALPDEEILYDVAELFKVLVILHVLRLSVFYLNLRCVCMIWQQL